MALPSRPIAFVLASSNHGTMILNRNDVAGPEHARIGVGWQILSRSAFDPQEVDLAHVLLDWRRRSFGDGVVAIDGGANIGVHTIEWARHMHGWGRVLAFEAQELVFYALAGNIAINNCMNARARWAALGERPGEIAIPQPDYHRAASFGSLELKERANNERIGQAISYQAGDMVKTPMTSVDALALDRLDFFKLDVESMELEVLRGARETLARHRPILLVEVIKSDANALQAFARELGYATWVLGMNMLAVHASDPLTQDIRVEGNQLHFGRVA
ncbi:FkbM family methyltransferase [Ramlibacter sp.]|uniref:FkbM family methyltransferase n=1 Tax=Ramlibacter sp. TaxID=1917967 RepID=UPI003D0B4B09